ncbi:MAG: DUF541 domain-containing protein [Proteobacteria bacterium]|nr:MAG: DUF541 domain-containing protein [Pseudomonadota bacterium]
MPVQENTRWIKSYSAKEPPVVKKPKLLNAALILAFAKASPGLFAAEPRSINVTGVGSVPVVPDQVSLVAGIEIVDKTALAVKTKSDEVMRKLIAIAAQEKVESRDLQSDRVMIEVDQVGAFDESVKAPVRFRARRTLRIRLRDISRYEGLVTALFNGGANTLYDINFQSSKMFELKNEARIRAMKDARANAEVFAKEAGLKLGKPLTIQESDQSTAPALMMVRAMKSDAATIAVGEIGINATVQVSFEFE